MSLISLIAGYVAILVLVVVVSVWFALFKLSCDSAKWPEPKLTEPDDDDPFAESRARMVAGTTGHQVWLDDLCFDLRTKGQAARLVTLAQELDEEIGRLQERLARWES